MKMMAGLWVDHKKAVIVFVDGKSEKKVIVISNLEKKIQISGALKDFKKYGRRDFSRRDMESRDITVHVIAYFDKVISFLRGAKSVLILGPGELKKELVKRIKKSSFPGAIARVETADKMTDGQIAARVRRYFAIKPA